MSLTVIVPVHDGSAVLPRCVEALQASTLSESEWDLVIVDDGSGDESAAWAVERGLDVRHVPDGPKGPAEARNLGARGATGAVLVFVDADVCVAPDALERFSALFEARPDLGAAFGAYDDRPEDPGFCSQYRNLYHRYVHLRGGGPAETFWAGCGAVRRGAFEACAGFDQRRYPRPQVEDIELGYRLRAQGWSIELDPSIECRHLKAWTLLGIVRTDLFDRGIPWMRLLLERRQPASLNVRGPERAKAVVVGGALLTVPLAVWTGTTVPLAIALGALLVVVLANADLYRWFAARRGWFFTVRAVGMNLVYYATACAAAVLGTLGHQARRLGATR